MGDIVNLNDRRKQKARKDRQAEAASNRVKFGRTKSQKDVDEKTRSADVRKLDAARRDRPHDPSDDGKGDKPKA